MAKITIDRDRCKGCGLCVDTCPKKVLALDSRLNAKGYTPAEPVHMDLCIACALCARMCPEVAITVER